MERIGRAYGLAWTPAASRLIQINTIIRKGSGKLWVDGDIDHSFLTCIETVITLFHNLDKLNLEKVNITFQIPGIIDGVSAMLPLFMSLHAAATKAPINQNVAFTGALSSGGEVLPIDEINSKIEACYRAKLDSIVFPMANVQGLGSKMWGDLVLCPVKNVTEALVVSVPSETNVIKLKR
jgi:predicted ATP-dependent protease